MYWTLELASKLEDAPWPATKDELIDYAMRSTCLIAILVRSSISMCRCAILSTITVLRI